MKFLFIAVILCCIIFVITSKKKNSTKPTIRGRIPNRVVREIRSVDNDPVISPEEENKQTGLSWFRRDVDD